MSVTINGTPLSPMERILSVPYARVVHGLRVTTNHSVILSPVAGSNVVDAAARHAVIGGGYRNAISSNAWLAVIDGGSGNRIDSMAELSAIGGGSFNFIYSLSHYASIAGGAGNIVMERGLASAIGGGWQNVIGSTSEYAVIGGGFHNVISNGSSHAVIAGGQDNFISRGSGGSSIAGGQINFIDQNTPYAAIGGGMDNGILNLSLYAHIGGGRGNLIGVDSAGSVIAGGRGNQIVESESSAILGGEQNKINGPLSYAVIAGGLSNAVFSGQSFAAGTRARALTIGSFVWGDASTGTVEATANNQTTFRSAGGFRIFTSAAQTSGVQVAANSGAWTSISDVNAKEAFAPVDSRDVLAKVAALPITTWRYKGQAAEIRHMGPTAQDFYAAFGLGDLPGSGITAVDADGVALAAIQALARENAELKARLAELERRLGL